MCTQHSANEITVCDVAVGDVRRSLGGLAVSFEPSPVGTRVVNHDEAQTTRFRVRLAEAIANHGGRLAPLGDDA